MSDETPQSDATPTVPSTPAEPATPAPPAAATPGAGGHSSGRATRRQPPPPRWRPRCARSRTGSTGRRSPLRPQRRASGFFVPKWVAVVAAAIVAALVFGGIGYAIGDSNGGGDSHQPERQQPPGPRQRHERRPHASRRRSARTPGQRQAAANSNGNGNGNGNSNGNGQRQRQQRQRPDHQHRVPRSRDRPTAPTAPRSPRSRAAAPPTTPASRPVTSSPRSTARRSPQRPTLVQAVHSHSSGDQVTITYTRDGNSATAKVTLSTNSTSQSS